MRYTIRKHPGVEDDLFQIVTMIASYAGLAGGLAKTDEINDFIESLADFPKIGTVRNELYSGLRAIPASEKAIVCFTVDDNTRTVFILSITYGGADWMSRVRDRG